MKKIALLTIVACMSLLAVSCKDQQKKEEAPAPAPAPAPVVKAAPEPVKEEGLTPEVVAVIAAAVASLGYGPGAVKAIRPIERNGWKQSGRTMGMDRSV